MKILDLFCGAGGAAMGYHQAGFEVVGIDIKKQKRYPFEFIQGDALDTSLWGEFDAIHASPPCQGYSRMSHCRPGLADESPKLIEPVRELLKATGKPYMIENVPNAPLNSSLTLCGHSFGLRLYRHRLWECNWPVKSPEHPRHTMITAKAGRWQPGMIMSVSGHVAPIKEAKEAMGIDWMTRDELVEAIPPKYTEFIGHQLMEYLNGVSADYSD